MEHKELPMLRFVKKYKHLKRRRLEPSFTTSKVTNYIPAIIIVEEDQKYKCNGIQESEDMTVQPYPLKKTDRNKEQYIVKDPPTWSQNFRSYCVQYCDATTIHGIKYIGERGRLVIERIFWTIIVSILCMLCLFLIVKTYQKWVRSPVIVTFATTETAIWNIPFPAITICPDIKSDPEVFNYTEVMRKKLFGGNVTKLDNQYFDALSVVCSKLFNRVIEKDFVQTNFTTTERIFADLLTLMPNFDPLNMSTIYWQGKPYDWHEVLSSSVTKEGLCYTFNMLNYDEILKDPEKHFVNQSLPNFQLKEWSFEGGYPNENEEDTFPRRSFLSGINGGFIFEGLFANHSHLDYACNEGLKGFKVTLHHPSELPDMDKHFRVPLDEAVIVAVRPRRIQVADELKWYKPEDRKCYFSDEKPLAFFKSYTQHNCLNECLRNYTLSECRCLAFYMPGLNSSAICGPGKKECMERSKVNYLLNETNNYCDCLPCCNSLQYDVEITQSAWDWYELFALIRRLGWEDPLLLFDYKQSHVSKLIVFYKDLQFLASERHQLYSYTDLFSNIGGLLGLFIGFSVTSLIEIVYFLSLRVACNVRKFGKKFWSGEPELRNAEEKHEN